MSDAVNDAAQILLPLLAAGANTAVQEASKEVGKGFARAAGDVLGRIQKFLHRPDPDVSELAAALQCGIEESLLSRGELAGLVRLYRNEGGSSQFNIEARNVVMGEFHGKVDFR